MKGFGPKPFIGMESSNLADFRSPCCGVCMSLEPLCRLVCAACGRGVRQSDAIHWGADPRNVSPPK